VQIKHSATFWAWQVCCKNNCVVQHTRQQQYINCYTLCLKKRCHFYFCNNFGKCTPILIILSLLNCQMYCGGSWDQNVHLKSIAALPCETWMHNCTTQCQRYILFYDDKLTNGWCFVDLFLYFFIISACWCHSDILFVTGSRAFQLWGHIHWPVRVRLKACVRSGGGDFKHMLLDIRTSR